MNKEKTMEELQSEMAEAVQNELKKEEAKKKIKEKKKQKAEKKKRENAENEKLQKMYDMVMDYENMLHERNQKRIKIGLRCIYIIPAIFLFLMFTTGSSKIIFLVFWILSLFIIAVYLICVEYVDYNLQQKMHEINGEENGEVEALIDLPEPVEEKVALVVEKLEGLGGEDE